MHSVCVDAFSDKNTCNLVLLKVNLTDCCLARSQLCFALSMIGNPQIVLLDEPSSGMDPKSKQRMW